MNHRNLSEQLDDLATRLEKAFDLDDPNVILEIAKELRRLSNEKYAPGNSATWEEIKPKNTKKTFISKKTGKKLPF